MFYKEMIVVCCENYVEYIGAICGQNTEILVLRLVVPLGFKGIKNKFKDFLSQPKFA